MNPLNQGTGAGAINEPGQNKTNFDRFLSNVSKRCFGLSGVLLKLCRLILGLRYKIFACSVINYSGELESSRIYKGFSIHCPNSYWPSVTAAEL